MKVHQDIGEPLAGWLAQRLGVAEVSLSELKRHAEGFSWQTFTLACEWTDPDSGDLVRQGFAVRREPEDGLLAPYDIEGQFRLHNAILDFSDVPMPGLYWLEMDPSVLGMPFYVMERMDGRVPVQWRGNDPDVFPDEETRRRIGLDFVDVLSRIHAIDIGKSGLGFLGESSNAEAQAIAEIDKWERFYEESFQVEVPLLRFLIGWLRRNLAVSGQVGLVHGDYRIGNFMLDSERNINAIFDWELAFVGDPAFDLAWAGMPLFRGRSPLLSQLLAKNEFLDRYEQQSGLHVDEDVFRFWTMFGHLRASAPHVRACRAFEEGRTTDLRLAAMGHQNFYILRQLADQLGWREKVI
jgi:aminoglycoside phosphotransferase (APT) family kinase protein